VVTSLFHRVKRTCCGELGLIRRYWVAPVFAGNIVETHHSFRSAVATKVRQRASRAFYQLVDINVRRGEV